MSGAGIAHTNSDICYAVSGTGAAHGAICYARHGTDMAYRATRKSQGESWCSARLLFSRSNPSSPF
eukprot:1557561-Rhodomonas_salina.1